MTRSKVPSTLRWRTAGASADVMVSLLGQRRGGYLVDSWWILGQGNSLDRSVPRGNAWRSNEMF
jgi:hypothetical protein